jgi:MoaA/NifB/PqqE/SkfB family radical SAM enzyme
MLLQMTKRLLMGTDPRSLWKLAWNMGLGGVLSVQRHKARLKRGQVFPPFLYISIINSCNLRCQGCWVDVAAKQETISPEAMHRLICEARAMGNVFFGIVGGEPFMHPGLFEILEAHPDCYFQVFTNGHFITPERARRLRRLGNVTPLISIEGTELISDERRGRKGVLSKSLQGVQNCLREKVFTGVCTSLCRTNIDDLLTEQWVDRLIEMGVHYTWFHVYRPMGPDACPDLCLTAEQQLKARKFVVEMRAAKPIIIIDAYFDGEGRALCPAATGLTHHINPWGDIEPCPIVQFSKESIYRTKGDPRSLRQKFLGSAFLRDFRALAQASTRGCIVLERPDLLKKLVEKHGAKDATVRATAAAELEAMQRRTSQHNPGNEVPEKSWVYRLAKRYWFYDFGVYESAKP